MSGMMNAQQSTRRMAGPGVQLKQNMTIIYGVSAHLMVCTVVCLSAQKNPLNLFWTFFYKIDTSPTTENDLNTCVTFHSENAVEKERSNRNVLPAQHRFTSNLGPG